MHSVHGVFNETMIDQFGYPSFNYSFVMWSVPNGKWISYRDPLSVCMTVNQMDELWTHLFQEDKRDTCRVLFKESHTLKSHTASIYTAFFPKREKQIIQPGLESNHYICESEASQFNTVPVSTLHWVILLWPLKKSHYLGVPQSQLQDRTATDSTQEERVLHIRALRSESFSIHNTSFQCGWEGLLS